MIMVKYLLFFIFNKKKKIITYIIKICVANSLFVYSSMNEIVVYHVYIYMYNLTLDFKDVAGRSIFVY